jgi:anti-sigma factor RsiW
MKFFQRPKTKSQRPNKTMNCENLQFDLSIYSDDILSEKELADVEQHLAQCPLCRQKRDDYLSLRQSLRVLKRPALSAELLNKVPSTIAEELQTNETTPIVLLSDGVQNWFKMRFMPYSIGTAASLLLGISLLWAILAGDFSRNIDNIAQYQNQNTGILLANANPKDRNLMADGLPPSVLPISDATPSVNPSGALVAVSNSLMRGKMKDEEVVVVADVFSNGLARIAEVVEPTNNWKTVNELEKALYTDPDYAPFVPSKADRRKDTVRVILKIQRVDIDVDAQTPKKK